MPYPEDVRAPILIAAPLLYRSGSPEKFVNLPTSPVGQQRKSSVGLRMSVPGGRAEVDKLVPMESATRRYAPGDLELARFAAYMRQYKSDAETTMYRTETWQKESKTRTV